MTFACLCAFLTWRASLNMALCRLAGAPAGWRRLTVVRVVVVGMVFRCGVVGMKWGLACKKSVDCWGRRRERKARAE